jgi:hypothetical protein
MRKKSEVIVRKFKPSASAIKISLFKNFVGKLNGKNFPNDIFHSMLDYFRKEL